MNTVAVSADGKYVAVGVEDILVKDGDITDSLFFFNTSDHNCIPMWSIELNYEISSLAISADGKYIVAISTTFDLAFLFNNTIPNSGEEKEYIWIVDWEDDINSVDISADGKYIILGGINDSAGLIISYNNSYASTGYDKTDEYLWYCDPDFEVLSVAISADGNYVAAGTDYSIVKDAEPDHSVFLLDTREEIDEDGFLLPI